MVSELFFAGCIQSGRFKRKDLALRSSLYESSSEPAKSEYNRWGGLLKMFLWCKGEDGKKTQPESGKRAVPFFGLW